MNAPDFLAVVDAEEGRIVHETPMPNVGDELHHFGWNRCSSACHGPDRSHLIVPGFRSSRIHIVNVADDPRRPRIEKVIEPQEIAEKTGYTRPHTVHCMPGDNVVVSMLGDRERRRRRRLRGPRRADLRGQGPLGERRRRRRRSTTTSGTSRARTCSISSEFGEPNAYEPGFDIEDVGAGPLRAAAALLGPRRSAARADPRPRRARAWCRSRCAGFTTPTPSSGFVGATLASNILRLHRPTAASRPTA